MDRQVLRSQLPNTLREIEIPELGKKIPGKVRDCYVSGDKRVLITSDRLSAFDVILTTLPFKGLVLNHMAAYWFEKTRSIVPNHIISHPHPNVFIGREVEIIPIEVVVRGYLAGSAWRDYVEGRPVSGIELPKGLRKSERFEAPLITPSTKAEQGTHDEPISSDDVVRRGIVESTVWEEVCEHAFALFRFGTEEARKRGLILVDTKYEFGILREPGRAPKVILADEIHTSDSSRFWIADSYEDRMANGEDPEMLDKEFFRRWLIERGYMGNGTPPGIPDDMRLDLAERYIAACERITGTVVAGKIGPVSDEIRALPWKDLLA
jgi:phosphoribosylaminoimidazole-succinocarboxamide synthase